MYDIFLNLIFSRNVLVNMLVRIEQFVKTGKFKDLYSLTAASVVKWCRTRLNRYSLQKDIRPFCTQSRRIHVKPRFGRVSHQDIYSLMCMIKRWNDAECTATDLLSSSGYQTIKAIKAYCLFTIEQIVSEKLLFQPINAIVGRFLRIWAQGA